MNSIVYELKDNCRINLVKYMIRAFSYIPHIKDPLILDMGCGTGVPALALTDFYTGTIYAVDSDDSCLSWLRQKVDALNCSDRIKVIHASVFDSTLPDIQFDVVLAEGLLNMIGFEAGLPLLIKYLKQGGFLMIHDELNDDLAKRMLFERYHLKLLNSFVLDETVWWNDYYHCMENAIRQQGDGSLFENEKNEISEFKRDPEKFKSIYYILQK